MVQSTGLVDEVKKKQHRFTARGGTSKPKQIRGIVENSPCFGKVSPVGHDNRTQHHVVLGEVAVKKVCGANHRNSKHVGYLVSMG